MRNYDTANHNNMSLAPSISFADELRYEANKANKAYKAYSVMPYGSERPSYSDTQSSTHI